jgi:phosphoribosylglycinamide formyltransferase-1
MGREMRKELLNVYPKKRIAVLVSGGGSNLQAILDAIGAGRIPGEVVLVLSTSKKAYALERARLSGILAAALPLKAFETPEACQRARAEAIIAARPDLLVLAGYLGMLPADIVARYASAILNIHPALLPSFGGKGMYGEHVHQAVLDAGCRVSGATVQFIDDTYDTGPIALQRAVPVFQTDTAETLAARVLKVEHVILPLAVELFCKGRLSVVGGRAVATNEEEVL